MGGGGGGEEMLVEEEMPSGKTAKPDVEGWQTTKGKKARVLREEAGCLHHTSLNSKNLPLLEKHL